MSFLLYFNTFRFSSINKEISLSSRSLLVSRISFSLTTSKFGKHSLFSSGKRLFRSFFHRSPCKPNLPNAAFVENLSNRSSGVQIPWDICTRFGCYLYSTIILASIEYHDQARTLIGVQLNVLLILVYPAECSLFQT